MSLADKPPFAEVCGCVLIVLNKSQQDRYDRANLEQRKHLMEVAYRAGADCIPLADCEVCNGWGHVHPVEVQA